MVRPYDTNQTKPQANLPMTLWWRWVPPTAQDKGLKMSAWPQNSPDLYLIEPQWDVLKTRQPTVSKDLPPETPQARGCTSQRSCDCGLTEGSYPWIIVLQEGSIDAQFHGEAAELCSLLVTSTLGGLNVVADRCIVTVLWHQWAACRSSLMWINWLKADADLTLEGPVYR